jgi:hypothetical protein
VLTKGTHHVQKVLNLTHKKEGVAGIIWRRTLISGGLMYSKHCGPNEPSDCTKRGHFRDYFERLLAPQETLLHRVN